MRGTLLVVALFALLPRVAAAAEPAFAVDFDGDGRHDRVVLDHERPSFLHIWLSASNTTHVLYSRKPLQRVAVADLDGDRRPELIARDSESRIQVWVHRRMGFLNYRPRHGNPTSLRLPVRRNVHETDADSVSVLERTAAAPLALLRASAKGPFFEARRAGIATGAPTRHLFVIPPFAPRPPPARLSL